MACSRNYKPELPGYIEQEFSYYDKYFVSKVASCQPDEHFNTNTKQCQKCPDGQSWNPQTNSCFTDCTDEKTNKYGWADGSCTDCSAAKTTGEIYRCFCGSLGLGVPETLTDVGVIGKPGYFLGKCSNGYSFEYRDPDYKPDPKPDDNTTKPDNPDPQPDPDNPQPDPGGDSGGGGNSGGGNNGGSQDNPNPNPGGGSGDNPKPNPNPGGGSGGGGNGNNKDDDPKFDLDKEFNFSDISDSYNGFFSESKSKIESIIGE